MKLVVNADPCAGDGVCLGFGPEGDFLSVYDDEPAASAPVSPAPIPAPGIAPGPVPDSALPLPAPREPRLPEPRPA